MTTVNWERNPTVPMRTHPGIRRLREIWWLDLAEM
jgi:hypothetical protein